MTILKTVNLKKTYKNDSLEQIVLKGITTHINQGDFTGIFGPSGSGKTTLLYCLSALEPLTSGELYIEGKEVSKYSEKEIAELRKTEIGFVFQFYNLIPNLTVYENILLAKVIAKKTESNIDEMLELVGLLEFKNHYPNQISGGMQQRVAIARALINEPKIIFADEPTGNLDQKSGSEIMDLLEKLNKEKGVTIVLVTHNEDYLRYCTNIIRLLDGKIYDNQ